MRRRRPQARSAAGDAGKAATAFTGYTAPIPVSFRRTAAFSAGQARSR